MECEDPEFINNRVNARAELDMYDEALRDYDRAIALDPYEIGFKLNRMGLYVRLDMKEDALADASDILDRLKDSHLDSYQNGNHLANIFANAAKIPRLLKPSSCMLMHSDGFLTMLLGKWVIA